MSVKRKIAGELTQLVTCQLDPDQAVYANAVRRVFVVGRHVSENHAKPLRGLEKRNHEWQTRR